MEEFILRAKTHQIFLSLSIPTLIVGFVPNFDSNVPLIKTIFIVFVYMVWIFTLSKGLNNCMPARFKLNESFLTFNLFFFVIIFSFLVIFSDIGVYFTGWAVIIPLYFVFSFLYMYYFAAKALLSAERGRRASFGDHFGEMLLLMAGMIGVWFLQPRINALYEKHYAEEEGED